jgi:hypothetical protein
MKVLVSFTDREQVDWKAITKRVDEDIEKETKAFIIKQMKGGRNND